MPESAPAPRGKKARGPTRRRLDGDVEALAASIGAIVRRFGDIESKARALGIFTGDRGLLTCPKCGLMEDVLIGGTLVTYHEASDGQDTGLRFVEPTTADGRFTCPECGSEVEQDAKRRRTKSKLSKAGPHRKQTRRGGNRRVKPRMVE